ncbi:hypothetical protein ACFVS2_26720 [Brevibacillus sp. NPDC058079]|uniref:hypothetical protein n=1 Tax=Brevibacillus sp. NPDC058079 TaxID=3346330 RepID=UPI0036E765C3
MAKVYESDWAKLSLPTKTILERVDMTRTDEEIKIGEMVDIPFFKGVLTDEIADEIVNYQYSGEQKGYYTASKVDGVVKIKFLQQAF